MTDLTLYRDDFRETSTFGKFYETLSGKYVCETTERDRDHNRASTKTRPGACIPAGKYLCRRVDSPKFGDVFEVTGVPGRLHILIHAANWAAQLRGCIAPGLTRAVIDDGDATTTDDLAVTSSKKALAMVMALQKGTDKFWLTVVDAVPEQDDGEGWE